MRRRQLKWLWRRLHELAAMKLTREELLMKLGAARAMAPPAWRLIDTTVDKASAHFTFALNRTKLRRSRRREGRYLLRTNLTEGDPAILWQYYIQLVAVESDQAWCLSREIIGWRQSPPRRGCRTDGAQGGYRLGIGMHELGKTGPHGYLTAA